MNSLVITYSPIYLDWELGSGHPTNPVRAKLATELLTEQLKYQVTFMDQAPRGKRNQDIDFLSELHGENYVDNHVRGNNAWLWSGNQPEVATTVFVMFDSSIDRMFKQIPDYLVIDGCPEHIKPEIKAAIKTRYLNHAHEQNMNIQAKLTRLKDLNQSPWQHVYHGLDQLLETFFLRLWRNKLTNYSNTSRRQKTPSSSGIISLTPGKALSKMPKPLDSSSKQMPAHWFGLTTEESERFQNY